MPENTPPEIANGSFVSWDGGEGRVDLIVRTGTVPGVSGDIEATEDSPAARVVVWKDGKATDQKIGASTHTLRRIAPLDQEEKHDPIEQLLVMHRDHVEQATEAKRLPVSGDALRQAYERGIKSWPGEAVTALSSTDWALGRVEHLVKVAMGTDVPTNDADLLPASPAPDAAPVETADDEPITTPGGDDPSDTASGDIEGLVLVDGMRTDQAVDFSEEDEESDAAADEPAEGEAVIAATDIAETLAQIEEAAALPDDDE